MLEIEHKMQDKIKIIRGQRGTYGWEISIHGKDEKDMLARIAVFDDALKKAFPSEVKEKAGG